MRFHEKRFAVEYDRRMTAEGYPGSLLDIVLEELSGAGSVIDVGAGTGFFSVPLAEKGYRIIAVEPSVEMAKLLRGKLDDEVSRLVEVNISDWETWPARKADRLICVHSIYGIKSIKNAVLKMKECSDKAVLIIGDEGSCTLSGLIRDALKEKKSRDNLTDILPAAFRELGIDFVSREIEQKRETGFSDIKKEAEYYCFWNGIDILKCDIIEDIIRKNAKSSGGKYVFSGLYKDMLFLF